MASTGSCLHTDSSACHSEVEDAHPLGQINVVNVSTNAVCLSFRTGGSRPGTGGASSRPGSRPSSGRDAVQRPPTRSGSRPGSAASLAPETARKPPPVGECLIRVCIARSCPLSRTAVPTRLGASVPDGNLTKRDWVLFPRRKVVVSRKDVWSQ